MRRITVVTAVLLTASTASAGPLIITESVDDYSTCHGPVLSHQVEATNDFRNTMFQSNNPGLFTPSSNFTNSSVFVTDFADPDFTGQSGDNDTFNFDQANGGIAYYAGHGSCGPGDTTQSCSHDTNCRNPPSGAYNNGFCHRSPGDNTGTCSYPANSRWVFDGTCAHGRNGQLDYSSGAMKLGESAVSGGWAGAGTNGGDTFAVIDGSCAAMSNRPSELFALFAGVDAVGFTMVHTGDKSDSGTPSRAGSFAAQYIANPNGAVPFAWSTSINSNTQAQTGRECENAAGTQTFGGGKGFNGCGANMVMSMGVSPNNAQAGMFVTWRGILGANSAGTQSFYYYYMWTCNYDCNTWTFNIP